MDETLDFLEERFGAHPAAMVAVDDAGRVLWRNRFARALFPGLRRRARLLTGEEYMGGLAARLVHLNETGHFLFSEAVEGVCLCIIQRLSNDFSAEFSEVLSDYERDLLSLGQKTLALADCEEERARSAYLSAAAKHFRAAEECAALLSGLSAVRDLHPGRAFAVSAGEFCEFFAACVAPLLTERGISLSLQAESGLVALLNFSDFARALTYALDFFGSFVLSKKVQLSLSHSAEGECAFSLSGEDPYNLLGLYRSLKTGVLPRRAAVKQSALFFPLFCALNLLDSYRHRVVLSREDGQLVLRIFVRTTLEFPSLIVRADEGFSPEANELSEILQETLYSEELFASLRDALSKELTETFSFSRVVTPKLFD